MGYSAYDILKKAYRKYLGKSNAMEWDSLYYLTRENARMPNYFKETWQRSFQNFDFDFCDIVDGRETISILFVGKNNRKHTNVEGLLKDVKFSSPYWLFCYYINSEYDQLLLEGYSTKADVQDAMKKGLADENLGMTLWFKM